MNNYNLVEKDKYKKGGQVGTDNAVEYLYRTQR